MNRPGFVGPRVCAAAVIAVASGSLAATAGGLQGWPALQPRVVRFVSPAGVETFDGKLLKQLKVGDELGSWTFMGTIAEHGKPRYAALENFRDADGHVVFVDESGIEVDLSKTSEPVSADSGKLFLGHTREAVLSNATDILGREVLARAKEPTYEEIRSIFPPNQGAPKYGSNSSLSLEAFVGTPETEEKVYFEPGGSATRTVDVAFLQPSIKKVIEGGYLPAFRFVWPESDGAWTELIAFAPFRLVNDNHRSQSVWYRMSRVESGHLKWSRYFDSFVPFHETRVTRDRIDDGAAFWHDLEIFRIRWNQIVAQEMKIHLPDERVANMARFSLLVPIMTDFRNDSLYGIPAEPSGVGYGDLQHEGFPDAFTTQIATMMDWGLIERSGRHIDYYLKYIVRDDGSILYRGPETGQYGRILALLARFVTLGGDPQILISNRQKIEGVVHLLLGLRQEGLALARDDPAYGLLVGRSEADSFSWADPTRYNKPYFSNSAEAVLGFSELGDIWLRLGRERKDETMQTLGINLKQQATDLQRDLASSIERSKFKAGNEAFVPAYAGAAELPDVAVARHRVDPQLASTRVYMEMLDSGVLTPDVTGMVRSYLDTHHGLMLRLPLLTWGAEKDTPYASVGFLSQGFGYSLVQDDRIREALLFLYSEMAHQYTRGTWIAPEERDPLGSGWDRMMHYGSAGQEVVAEMVRWLLTFEDPRTGTLWLAKGIPQAWLEDGKTIVVDDVPTKYGAVSYSITSHMNAREIDAKIKFPSMGISAETRLRLRAGGAARLQTVKVDGKKWLKFDANDEVIVLPRGTSGLLHIVATFSPE